MKTFLTAFLLAGSRLASVAGDEVDPYLDKSSSLIQAWATGYTGYAPGENVSDSWENPTEALGQAEGNAYDVVSLGDGGQITLTFSRPIIDGPDYDFAVFENSFSSSFLELAYVEVSSDGEHFVRFRSQSLTSQADGTGGKMDADEITGLASEHKQGRGTQFDLSHMSALYNYVSQGGGPSLSGTYKTHLLENYPYLETNKVQFVRLIDIVGDGSASDSYGNIIYDPYPTTGSAGFDLDAIAVINRQSDTGATQTIQFAEIPNQKLSFETLTLCAVSDSGLPVSYQILDGPGTVSSNLLTFSGAAGEVVVQAQQSGDATYAPAEAQTRSFNVAENLQHIYVEPVPNQISASGTRQVYASADSGLPVTMEVSSGPFTANINTTNHLLSVGVITGSVVLRAYQSGDETHAPAEDVYTSFSIVASGDPAAPQTFAEWSADLGLSADAELDTDGDGANNLQEFMAASDPQSSFEVPRLAMRASTDQYGESQMQFTFCVNGQARGRTQFQATDSPAGSWSNAVPEIISSESVSTNGQSATVLTIQMPADENRKFYRLLFEEDSE
jgi:hypothetical protein